MTNGTTKTSEVKSHGDCEWCPDSKDVDLVNGMCMGCMAKQLMTGTTEVKPKSDLGTISDFILGQPMPTRELPQVEVPPSTSPINERLKKAYLDQYNSTVVSGMAHEEIKYKIADMEDLIKVLQAQVQALRDIDDEWTEKLDKTKREVLREKDKQYRAKARPRVKLRRNAQGDEVAGQTEGRRRARKCSLREPRQENHDGA